MTEPFILFSVAGTTYALRSKDVAHIEMVDQVTAVPNAVHFVDGVVFSRGQVVPALNLRARFGFDKVPYDLSSRLLVVHACVDSATYEHETCSRVPGSVQVRTGGVSPRACAWVFCSHRRNACP